MTYRTVTVTAQLNDSIVEVTPEISGNIEAEAVLATVVRSANYEEYSGTYEFTPMAETQTVETAEKVLLSNITINPIPSNYGLITWNGATLTVS